MVTPAHIWKMHRTSDPNLDSDTAFFRDDDDLFMAFDGSTLPQIFNSIVPPSTTPTVTISSVVLSSVPSLTIGTPDYSQTPLVTFKVSGIAINTSYNVTCIATLSDASVCKRTATIFGNDAGSGGGTTGASPSEIVNGNIGRVRVEQDEAITFAPGDNKSASFIVPSLAEPDFTKTNPMMLLEKGDNISRPILKLKTGVPGGGNVLEVWQVNNLSHPSAYINEVGTWLSIDGYISSGLQDTSGNILPSDQIGSMFDAFQDVPIGVTVRSGPPGADGYFLTAKSWDVVGSPPFTVEISKTGKFRTALAGASGGPGGTGHLGQWLFAPTLAGVDDPSGLTRYYGPSNTVDGVWETNAPASFLSTAMIGGSDLGGKLSVSANGAVFPVVVVNNAAQSALPLVTLSSTNAGGHSSDIAIGTSSTFNSAGQAWTTFAQQDGTGDLTHYLFVNGIGDPYSTYAVTGGATWTAGIDNSAGDQYCISVGGGPGTSDQLRITPTGLISLLGAKGTSFLPITEAAANSPYVIFFDADQGSVPFWTDGTGAPHPFGSGGATGSTTLTPGATVNIDLALNSAIYTITANQATTFTTSGATVGQQTILAFKQDGTGGWQPSFPGSFASALPNVNLAADPTIGATTYFKIECFGASDFRLFVASNPSAFAVAQGGAISAVPLRSVSADTAVALADDGGQIYHPSSDTTARTWTIPANASVPLPIGFTVTFNNDTSAGTITIAITSDTLVLAGTGSTGSRTLAADGIATATKVTSTRWKIAGVGIT